ncbi:OTU domain-containing protein [Sorangium sp. So ce1389]|uniref:OTU domain-containing protein n=1 Tax=Sorangium sp. So ce1389 TaxID=3133336 RepID=UPI003F5E5275
MRPTVSTVQCPRCASRCTVAPCPEDDGRPWTDEPLIIQEPVTGLYPVSEYHARLQGTTPFVMTDETNWNTYVRSDSSRYGKQQAFSPDFVTKPQNFMGFGAKSGTYKNILARPEIKKSLFPARKKEEEKKKANDDAKPPPRLPVQSGFVYDALLSYRIAACRYIGDKLDWSLCTYEIIANADNDYPCLIVKSPGGPTRRDVPDAKKLETNEKYWTRFAMAAFTGLVNRNAWTRGIPIELTMRSSFGFLAPSVAETGASFRINVGIVPVEYMNVLAESIADLYEIFSESFEEELKKAKPGDNFGKVAEKYNKGKREVFDKKQRAYDEYFAEEKKNQEASSRKRERSKSTGSDTPLAKKRKKAPPKPRKPVILGGDAKDSWGVLWAPGDSSGKTVLTQVADRSHRNLEGFSDLALKSPHTFLEGTVSLPDRFTLKKDSISLKLPTLLKLQSFDTYSPKGQKLIIDREFWSMIQLLVLALDTPYEKFAQFYDPSERWGHVGGLYGFLDRANVDFIRGHASAFIDVKDGYASDSDEEEDIEVGGRSELGVHGRELRFGLLDDDEVKERRSKKVHVYSKKHLTATGMRAIHLAHHCCRVYAGERGVKLTEIKVSADRMYYETKEAITKVPIQKDVPVDAEKRKQQQMKAASILFFDLNHCNAMQDANPRVAFEEFDLVVLDHTSATTSRVHFYLKEALRHDRVRLVLLVTSGIKNEQSGADFNTYGTVRVVARSREERDHLFDEVREVDRLADQTPYQHPKESHAVRRAYKEFGFVPKTKDFLRPGFTAPLRTQEPNPFRFSAPDVGTIVFEVLDVPADGDCLFAAISSVASDFFDPPRVRKQICDLLGEHMELVPSGMDLQVGLGFSTKRVDSQESYLAAMAEPLVWGGMTEIQAYSYKRTVLVFETAREPVFFRRGVEKKPPDIDWANLPKDTIFLAFYGNHYAALLARS